MKAPTLLLILCLTTLLAGCDMLGIETPDKVAAKQEAEGKAVGGACRHSGRALEDCYEMNRRAPKAAIYAGWRDMDAYMRENNIAVVAPAEETAARAPVPGKADDGTQKAADNPTLKPSATQAAGSSYTRKAVTRAS